MTDISKCDGEGCSRKERCWRFLAPSNEFRQAYMAPEIRGVGCGHFWEVESKSQERRLMTQTGDDDES